MEPSGGGKSGGKMMGKMYEWWKMWLGHLAWHVCATDIRNACWKLAGVWPAAVHLQQCQAARDYYAASSSSSSKGKGQAKGEGESVGLNSAFVEFKTPGRL